MTTTPWDSLIADMLGSAGNFGLQLDPLSRVRLEALEGKSVRFLINTPPHTLTMNIIDGELNLEAGSRGPEPNVIVSGSLADIGAFLANSDRADPDRASNVRIDGDETVLNEIARLLADFEPDLARPMSTIMGRERADNLIGLAEAGIALLKSAAQSASHTARQGAQQQYVGEQDFDTLLNRLDTLQLRVDRLTARLAQAESNRSSRQQAEDTPANRDAAGSKSGLDG